jgi:hypothetical protein
MAPVSRAAAKALWKILVIICSFDRVIGCVIGGAAGYPNSVAWEDNDSRRDFFSATVKKNRKIAEFFWKPKTDM